MRRAKNFTLVELLVVIAIITILAAMLLPTLEKARKSAILVDCMSNMRGITQAMIMYADDHSEFLPPNYAATQGLVKWRYYKTLYSMPLLMETGFIEDPNVFYSKDAVRYTYKGYEKGWSEIQDGNFKYYDFEVISSYCMREPASDFQQMNPASSSHPYYAPYKVTDTRISAIVGDRFTFSKLTSEHENGWHSGHVDGSASWHLWDSDMPYGVSWEWSNRYKMWSYWDNDR